LFVAKAFFTLSVNDFVKSLFAKVVCYQDIVIICVNFIALSLSDLLYFFHAIDGRHLGNDGLQLAKGMNAEIDGAMHDAVNSVRGERIHR
jgi:hypothetical protein